MGFWFKNTAVVLGVLGVLSVTASQGAGQKNCLPLKRELQSRRVVLVSQPVQKRLNRVSKWMKKKETEAKALETLKTLASRGRPSDLVTIYRYLAMLHAQRENFSQALGIYQQAMDLKKMSYREHLNALYTQVVLYLHIDKTLQAEQTLEQWFCLTEEVTPRAYYLKAVIQMRKKNQAQALKWVMKAIQSTPSPQKPWLALAATLYMQKENYEQALVLLHRLMVLDPNREGYWKSFSQAYLALKKEAHSLAGWDLTRKMSFLKTQSDWLQLIGLFSARGQPLQAARLLEQTLKSGPVKKNHKHYKMLGDFWFSAKEKDRALKAYQQAARKSEDGEIFLRIARHYMEDEQWGQAIRFFNQALQKGNLKNQEEVYIYLGIALFRNGKPAQAIKSLEQILALEAESSWIKQAREWIDHISAQTKGAA